MSGSRSNITFTDRVNSIKVQHAVTEVSRQIFLFVFLNLFRGDLCDIKDSVERNLGSISRYKRAFTKDELEHIEAGAYKTWNLPLLYKLIQNSCGLQNPPDQDNFIQEEETLEIRITRLRDWKNESGRNFFIILTKEEMEDSLENLRNVSSKIVLGVSEKVDVNESDLARVNYMINYIIEDVKNAPTPVPCDTSELSD